MSAEDRILDAIASLAAATQKGFAEMTGRYDAIEARLTVQEKTSKATRLRQDIQSADIEALKKAVQELAEQAPLREALGGIAIRREDAYSKFSEAGTSNRIAMRALKEAGAIRPSNDGQHNTCVIRLDGKCTRVIIVNFEQEKGE